MTKEKENTLPSEGDIGRIPWIVDRAARTYWVAEMKLPFPLDAIDAVAYKSLRSQPTLWTVSRINEAPGLIEYVFSLDEDSIDPDLGSLEISMLGDELTLVRSNAPHGTSVGQMVTLELTGQPTVHEETRRSFQRSIIQKFLSNLDDRAMLVETENSDISSIPFRESVRKTQSNTVKRPPLSIKPIPEPEPCTDPSKKGPCRDEWFLWYFWMDDLKIRLASGDFVSYDYIGMKVNLSGHYTGVKYREWKSGYDDSLHREQYESFWWLKDES